MVALSDSRVISGSSALTTSPGATWISMTGTSAKSPRSGTLTSVAAAMAAPLSDPSDHTSDGSGLPGSMPYRAIASATVAAGTVPSSASDASAATAT